MIEKYINVYEENKQLDEIFIKKYNHDELVKKNKLELFVEIGELANETRCFKYWSKKEINYELVGYELADTIIMTLCFFNYLDIDINDIEIIKDNKNNLDLFFEIYDLVNIFVKTEDKILIQKIFVLLINMGYNLGFTDNDIVNFCLNKINKDKERLDK